MKGVLFTEFLHFAADEFGGEIAARLGADAQYQPGGEYDHRQFAALADHLSAISGRSTRELLAAFGSELFRYFAKMYPVFFAGADSAVGFLSRVDTYIHGELMKLYPGAQFPRFDVMQTAVDRLEMVYRSERRLADLAEGLIRGCVEHFGDAVAVCREDLPGNGQQVVRFIISPVLP